MSAQANLVNRGEVLVVMIDFQEKLLPVMAGKDPLLANAVRLAKFAAIAKLPVLLTEQQKLGPTATELRAALGEIPALGKLAFDCFGAPAFAAALAERGRRTLALCGIESHICVVQTALSALAAGHRVQIVADAVASRAPTTRRSPWRGLPRPEPS